MWPDFDLHVLMLANPLGEILRRQASPQALERHFQPLADAPGHMLVVPDAIESSVRNVIGKGHLRLADGFVASKRLPEQVAPFGFLGPQAFGLALRLVGIVMDDGVP